MAERDATRASVAAWITLAGVLLVGCAPTLLALTSHRSHKALDDVGLAALERRARQGPVSKSDVLLALGPPIGVIGQDDGEIFLYRRVARDTSSIHLNPGYVIYAAPSIPVYVASDVSGRDDLLMVFFGSEGEVRGIGMRESISDVTGSRPAALGERMQEWLP